MDQRRGLRPETGRGEIRREGEMGGVSVSHAHAVEKSPEDQPEGRVGEGEAEKAEGHDEEGGAGEDGPLVPVEEVSSRRPDEEGPRPEGEDEPRGDEPLFQKHRADEDDGCVAQAEEEA